MEIWDLILIVLQANAFEKRVLQASSLSITESTSEYKISINCTLDYIANITINILNVATSI